MYASAHKKVAPRNQRDATTQTLIDNPSIPFSTMNAPAGGSRFFEILFRVQAENDELALGMNPAAVLRLAQRQLSRESQRVPANLGGVLSYRDPTGDHAVSRVMRSTNRKRVAA